MPSSLSRRPWISIVSPSITDARPVERSFAKADVETASSATRVVITNREGREVVSLCKAQSASSDQCGEPASMPKFCLSYCPMGRKV